MWEEQSQGQIGGRYSNVWMCNNPVFVDYLMNRVDIVSNVLAVAFKLTAI